MTYPENIEPCATVSDSEISHWDKVTEVAIVGFGGAGGCAAIAAADSDAKVELFEVASASGGSTALSSAEIYLGGSGGTRVQRACGFEDSTEDMFNYMMMCAGPQADEKKIRNYCENAVEHFNWLSDTLGVPFKDSFHQERAIMCLTDDGLLYTGSEKAYPFSEHAKPCPRGHNLHVEGDNGGPMFMGIVTKNVEKRNNININYECRALTLIRNDKGRVVGLIVRENQKLKTIRADLGVILCAGGFVMNEEMVKKFAPKLSIGTQPIGNPGDTGSGILMGMGAGGSTVNMHEGFISLPFYPPASMTFGIAINDKGQRFINEDVYHGRLGQFAIEQQSDRLYFIVSVEHYADYEQSSYLGAPIAATGESIAELEAELGLRKKTLQHTLAVYNEDCKIGKDSLFHKAREWLSPLDPPLVALDLTPGRGAFLPYFTLGGLDTLPTGEVTNASGNVIPGLFAAGRNACGVVRTAAGYSSGMSVGDATFSGRLAGMQATKQTTG